MKFALGALIFFVAFLVVVEPALDLRNELAARAGRASTSLAQYVEAANEQTRLNTQIVRGQERFGPIDVPATFEQRSSDLNENIRTILDDNSIERESIVTRSKQLPNNTLADAIPRGQRVEVISKNIRFDATPEQLADVIAAFEQSPFVVGVSHVNIRRDREGQRRVLVDLTLDSWVLTGQGVRQ